MVESMLFREARSEKRVMTLFSSRGVTYGGEDLDDELGQAGFEAGVCRDWTAGYGAQEGWRHLIDTHIKA